MTEVPLTEIELQKHHAVQEGHKRWYSRRAFFWDGMNKIEKATKRQLDMLETLMDELIDIFCVEFSPRVKVLVKDYEIVGSYGKGYAHFCSDMDIQLACASETNQAELFLILKSDRSKFRMLRMALSRRMKHKVDIKFGWCHNKTTSACYSLKERKLYNRQVGVALLKNEGSRWSREEMAYVNVNDRPIHEFVSALVNQDGSFA